jgi:hypothetical protein
VLAFKPVSTFPSGSRPQFVNASNRNWSSVLLTVALAGMPCACAHLGVSGPKPEQEGRIAISHAIQAVKQKYAPDARLAIFDVGVQRRGRELILTGEVDRAEARFETVQAVECTGAKVTDRIKVLPDEELGDQVWGIACLSVASARLQPEHKAEPAWLIDSSGCHGLWCPGTFRPKHAHPLMGLESISQAESGNGHASNDGRGRPCVETDH